MKIFKTRGITQNNGVTRTGKATITISSKLKSKQPAELTMVFLHDTADLPGLSEMFDNDNE